MEKEELCVLMLPCPAFGHLVPFFQLSLALAKSGVHVSYVSTPRNIERLPNVPPNLAFLITMVSLPMPKLQNGDLPKEAEATVDVPFEKLPDLTVAYDLLQYPFEKLVENQCPHWIVVDLLPHWAIEIAQKHKIPIMHFSPVSASTLVFNGPPQCLTGEGRVSVRPSPECLMSTPNWVDFPSSISLKNKHEANAYFDALYVLKSNGMSLGDRFAKVLNSCDAVSIRTCNEYEKLPINLLTKLLDGKAIIPTGMLPRDYNERNNITNYDYESSWKDIFMWLDKQMPKSTVFVGFGSECRLSKDQIHEIAYGLELSELPFIWALGKPKWANNGEVETILPYGFCERTRGKGVVKLGWAPQLEILGHHSIGGSLFHSGWGSSIETLQFGHCLVVLPMMFDQSLNARLLVDKGLAIEIDRAEDGSFSKDDIAKVLRIAMVSKEGESLRARAREAAAILGDKELQQKHYVGELVSFLKSHRV